LLVIMPAYNVVNQAIRICLAFEPPFSWDLIVRTPEQIERGLKENDWFLREIVEKGRILYEAKDGSVGPQSGGRLGRRPRSRRSQAASSRSGLFSLSASSREISQGIAARKRRRRAQDA